MTKTSISTISILKRLTTISNSPHYSTSTFSIRFIHQIYSHSRTIHSKTSIKSLQLSKLATFQHPSKQPPIKQSHQPSSSCSFSTSTSNIPSHTPAVPSISEHQSKISLFSLKHERLTTAARPLSWKNLTKISPNHDVSPTSLPFIVFIGITAYLSTRIVFDIANESMQETLRHLHRKKWEDDLNFTAITVGNDSTTIADVTEMASLNPAAMVEHYISSHAPITHTEKNFIISALTAIITFPKHLIKQILLTSARITRVVVLIGQFFPSIVFLAGIASLDAFSYCLHQYAHNQQILDVSTLFGSSDDNVTINGEDELIEPLSTTLPSSSLSLSLSEPSSPDSSTTSTSSLSLSNAKPIDPSDPTTAPDYVPYKTPLYISNLYSSWWPFFKYTLQSTGATFIKLGQYLSSRPDVLSPEICNVLAELQSANEYHDWESTATMFETEFGHDWTQFLYLDPDDLCGSGCIAQVYRGMFNVTKYLELLDQLQPQQQKRLNELLHQYGININTIIKNEQHKLQHLKGKRAPQDSADALATTLAVNQTISPLVRSWFTEKLLTVDDHTKFFESGPPSRRKEKKQFRHQQFNKSINKYYASDIHQTGQNETNGETGNDMSDENNFTSHSFNTLHSDEYISSPHHEYLSHATSYRDDLENNPENRHEWEKLQKKYQVSQKVSSFYQNKLQEHSQDTIVTVAVKVLHPDSIYSISRDLHIIFNIVKVVENLPFAKLQFASPVQLCIEFSRLMQTQLSMHQESLNLQRFNDSFAPYLQDDKNVSPCFPIPLLSSPSILVETYHSGTSMSDFLDKTTISSNNSKILSQTDYIDQLYRICSSFYQHSDALQSQQDSNNNITNQYIYNTNNTDDSSIDKKIIYEERLLAAQNSKYPPSLHDLRSIQQDQIIASLSKDQLDWLRKEYGKVGLMVFLTMCFQNGFFHSDMHPGNLIIDLGYDLMDPYALTTLTDLMKASNKTYHSSSLSDQYDSHQTLHDASIASPTNLSSQSLKNTSIAQSHNKVLDQILQSNFDTFHFFTQLTENISQTQIVKSLTHFLYHSSLFSSQATTPSSTINFFESIQPYLPLISPHEDSLFYYPLLNNTTASDTTASDTTSQSTSPLPSQNRQSARSLERLKIFHQYFDDFASDPSTLFPSQVFRLFHPHDIFLHPSFDAHPEEHYSSRFLQQGIPQPHSKPKLVIIDAGMSTALTKRDKTNFNDLFYAIAIGRGYEAAAMMIERAQPLSKPTPVQEQEFLQDIESQQEHFLMLHYDHQLEQRTALLEKYHSATPMEKIWLDCVSLFDDKMYQVKTFSMEIAQAVVSKCGILQDSSGRSLFGSSAISAHEIGLPIGIKEERSHFASDDPLYYSGPIKTEKDPMETLHITDDVYINLSNIPYNIHQTREMRRQFILQVGGLIQSVREKNFQLDSVGVVAILTSLITASRNFCIKLDTSFISLVIAVIIFEGVGRQLDDHLDIVTPSLSVILETQLQELSAAANEKKEELSAAASDQLQELQIAANEQMNNFFTQNTNNAYIQEQTGITPKRNLDTLDNSAI